MDSPQGIRFQAPPGMPQPTPEQIAQMQRQLAEEAAKNGMTVQQYVEVLKQRAFQQHQMQQQQMAQQQAQQQGGPDGQQQQQGQHQHQHQHPPQQQQQVQQPIQPGPPNPAAIAVANFLRSQPLKPRTVLHDEKRRDMFRVKRAIRALESPAYEKARKKNSLLPPVEDRVSAENTFKLLPLSLLALRVDKINPDEGHEGHGHGPKKRVKGLWNVRIQQHQEAHDDMYYIWLYEGSQWRTKLYAVGALALVVAVVLFPLWPLFMRQGVWYLSMGFLGLLGLFFLMAIFRLILFCLTVFAVPPGLWLYPNLFEDVGFFDSFRPVWAWHEDADAKKAARKAKKVARTEKANAKAAAKGKGPAAGEESHLSAPNSASATGASPNDQPHPAQLRQMQARVEEVEEE